MIYLNALAPWSDAGRAALAVRYGADEDGAPRVEFNDWWRSRDPFVRAISDLSNPSGRSCLRLHEHDSPALESAVTLLGVPESALELRQTMSDISEEGICAGWELGLENNLWRYIESDDAPHPYSSLMGHDDGDRALLRQMRDESGVWWVYDDGGNRAVPVEEFRAAFNEHGRWPDLRRRATVANILEDGWDRGLHAFDTRATCPCRDCRAERRSRG